MQRLPLQMEGILFRPVHLIAEKRMMETGQMNADLMRSPGLQLTFNVGIITKTLQYPVMGHCLLSVLVIDGHFLPLHRMTADRRIDGAFVFFEVSIDDCPVFSRDRMNFQLFRDRAMGEVIFADQKGTRSIPVNAVDNARTHDAVDAGKTVPAALTRVPL